MVRYAAFQTSIEKGNENARQVFLKYGYGGHFKGDDLLPPLHSAIFYEKKDVLENLLNHGFDIGTKFCSKDAHPLYLGLSEDTEDLIEDLHKRGAYVNVTTAHTFDLSYSER